jgi:type I restriction enzyme S subunit
MSFNTVRLGNLVSIKTGKLDANASSKDGIYPFFTCAKEPLKINSFSYDCECVLVAGNGDLNVKYYKGKFDAYQRTYIVECLDIKIINSRYLFHFLDTYLETLREQSIGGVIKYIKLENLTDALIPLPPLATQKRIAEILDAADALRRKDQELLNKYDELAQAIFIDMFGDPVKNEKGWEMKTIRDIGLKISDGPFGSNLKTQHYSKEGVRVIRLKNIGINSFNDEDSAYINIHHYENVLKKHTCIPGDILIGTLGEPNLRACILPSNIEKAVNKADCVMLRINPKICNQNYVAYLLNISSFVNSVANKLHGQTRTRISMGQVANLLIIIPPKSLQDKFSDFISNLKLQNDQRNIQSVSVSTLFNSLIQKAFKGELVS